MPETPGPKGPGASTVSGERAGTIRAVTGAKDYAFVVSSTSSSGSRPGVFRSNFVIANRKIA